MVFKRGQTYWYKFMLHGCEIRETARTRNRAAAQAAERKRHVELEQSITGFVPRRRVLMFGIAADEYLADKRGGWAAKTAQNEASVLQLHLRPYFGKQLVTDITAMDVATYREQRLAAGASEKTVALELGTLRGILLHHDLDATWKAIRKKVRLGKARKVGRVITRQEESALLDECRKSRSRSLYPAVVLAFEAGLRYSEIRLLQWYNIDLARRVLVVGKSKTDAGEGRTIPLSMIAHETLRQWATQFPLRKLNDFVFPSEKYGEGGKAYAIDVTRPIGTWKEGWESAKQRAGVPCRFHDMRHTCCTHLLEAGVSFAVVAEIMGWSSSTAVRMIQVYGHIGLKARQEAIRAVEQQRQQEASGWVQNWVQSAGDKKGKVQ